MIHGGEDMDKETGKKPLTTKQKILIVLPNCILYMLMVVDFIDYLYMYGNYHTKMNRLIPVLFFFSLVYDIIIEKKLKGKLSVIRIIMAVIVFIICYAALYGCAGYCI